MTENMTKRVSFSFLLEQVMMVAQETETVVIYLIVIIVLEFEN